MSDEDRIWDSIEQLRLKNNKLYLLSKSSKPHSFKIEVMQPGYIIVRFFHSGRFLKLEKERFISAHKMLKENQGKWIKTGSSRVKTKEGTLEWAIKKNYDGKMNGLSTAPWIAAILVEVCKDIICNDKKIGQALMMTN